MARLRGPQGCPWDREQTLESLRAFLLEETHEVLEAIDRGDADALARRDRRSDLRRRIPRAGLRRCGTLHGRRLAARDHREADPPASAHLRSLRPAARHARPSATSSGNRSRRRNRPTPEAPVAAARRAPSLPSLLRAYEIGTRVAAVGFDWPRAADVVDKIEEEVAELRQAVDARGTRSAAKRRWATCSSRSPTSPASWASSRSRRCGRRTTKFTKRFTALEARVHDTGRTVREMTLDELEREWNAVKKTWRTTNDGTETTDEPRPEGPRPLGQTEVRRRYNTTRLSPSLRMETSKLIRSPSRRLAALKYDTTCRL